MKYVFFILKTATSAGIFSVSLLSLYEISGIKLTISKVKQIMKIRT